jgi:ATP-dependent exoDNAse (exonuclease V) alpha subunit
MARLEASPELVALGGAGPLAEEIRYTTRSMLRVEERMAEIAFEMAAADRHPVPEAAFASTISKYPELSSEQQEAARQMTSARDIEVLAGLAGTGKSAAVAASKDAWEASGYRVRGAALSGIAAENLEK